MKFIQLHHGGDSREFLVNVAQIVTVEHANPGAILTMAPECVGEPWHIHVTEKYEMVVHAIVGA